MADNHMLELGRKILASQPFSVLLGAELTGLSAGAAEIRIPIRPEFGQQHGFVHGGIVSYAADNALTFAGGSVLGTGVVTSEFKINYLRPAMGTALMARATVVHHGQRQAVCRCDVFASADGIETPYATAQGTIVRLSSPNVSPRAGPRGRPSDSPAGT
ncbi:MAG: PaaI family thioesterase [Gemmatimonadota bacterium]|nr:PaaI family thioesterase [Gemmatimonadota bacterium]